MQLLVVMQQQSTTLSPRRVRLFGSLVEHTQVIECSAARRLLARARAHSGSQLDKDMLDTLAWQSRERGSIDGACICAPSLQRKRPKNYCGNCARERAICFDSNQLRATVQSASTALPSHQSLEQTGIALAYNKELVWLVQRVALYRHCR